MEHDCCMLYATCYMQMKYELFYLVGASKETELEAIKASAQEIVTAEGGVFDEKEVVEKRKLAYEVKHETHGFYVARRFELENPQGLQTITRNLVLNANILRAIISKASELPELKTKEERINAAAKAEKKIRTVKTEEVKTTSQAIEKKETTAKEEAVEDKKEVEDIDKKLEEILNI